MHKAFTLAEVLITIGIIGVVAAITLPGLVSDARYKILETSLKKGYSVLAQALDLYYAKNGEKIKSDGTLDLYELKNVIMPYFQIVKDCGTGSESGAESSCIPNNQYLTADKQKIVYKNFNGKTNMTMEFFDDGQFVVSDGMLILIENPRIITSKTLYLSIDVNGYAKRPNRLGQDLFMFQISDKGALLPMGIKGTTYYSENDEYCSTFSTNNMNGAGCTYKALNDSDFFKNLPK